LWSGIEGEVKMIKRAFDLLVAVAGLIVLAPLFAVAAVLIKLDSSGPVFYKGDRIGKDGVPFKIYKFRTMVIRADQMGAALTHQGDPRVTRVGRFLRDWKIDEILQLINVLRGEMSLVGPRPEAPGYVAHYTPEQMRVLEVKPGITGLTQVQFRHEEALLSSCDDPEGEYLARIMPHKLAIDLQYIKTRSFGLDLRLILDTFLCLFSEEEPTLSQEALLALSPAQDGDAVSGVSSQ
jgi:lipopolysaccharide/colanic/teichoic acid biosynthesis glycosyltransferase